jgi:Domain of unknown function (DUF4124)
MPCDGDNAKVTTRRITVRKLAWLAAALALCAQAEVYKWTDEKGQVHYGEEPPPNANTTTLKTPAPGPTSSDLPKKVDKPKEVAATGGGQMTAAQKAERCQSAKDELQTLQMDVPVGSLNDKKELVPYDDAQRAAKTVQAQALIKKYCP